MNNYWIKVLKDDSWLYSLLSIVKSSWNHFLLLNRFQSFPAGLNVRTKKEDETINDLEPKTIAGKEEVKSVGKKSGRIES
jgi:hypothetical protein